MRNRIVFNSTCFAALLAAMATWSSNAGAAEPYFFDNFDNGRTNSANGFRWNGNEPVVSDQAYSGTHSMRFRYGPDPDGEDSSAEQRFVLAPDAGSAPTEVWIEYMLFVPENWTHRSQSPNNNKLFGLWAEQYSSSGSIQVVFEYSRSGSSQSGVRVLCMSGSGCLDGDEHSHVFDTSMRGRWIRIRVHAKAGNGNGEVELWRDNTLVYSIYDYVHHYSGGNNYWRNGYILGWSNSGYSEQTDFFVDDFKVFVENPGWTVRDEPDEEVLPAPPTLFVE